MCYAPVEVYRDSNTSNWWRHLPESPDPERKPVFRLLKEEKGQAQPYFYGAESCSIRGATFRPYALFTAIEQGKRRFEKEIQL
jgi:hypothetical protein